MGMNKKVKKKWLRWLRSGQYDQIAGMMCAETTDGDNSFCCLGVLSNIHAETYGKSCWDGPDIEKSGSYVRTVKGADGSRVKRKIAPLEYRGHQDALPLAVTRWSGLSGNDQEILATMNDRGKTFIQIADYIEKNL